MYQDGWYPYTRRFNRLVQKYELEDEIDFADEETLIRLAQKVLEKTPRLEERVGVEAIACNDTDKQIVIHPPAVAQRLGKNSAIALKESLAILGLGLTHLTTMTCGCVFASVESDGCSELAELNMEVVIDEAAFSVSPPIQVAFPLSYSETLHICLGHGDYIRQVDTLELWGNADSEQGALDAILGMAIKHQEIGLPQVATPASYTSGLLVDKGMIRFRLGPKFLYSVQQWGFGSRQDWAMLLIDSCARILLAIPKKEIKIFETSAQSRNQRRRAIDNALAWRTHLTKANEGFRLMLWTTSDGLIEFANVGPKKELLIEE